MSKRRNHDAAFKARVALEALKGERRPLPSWRHASKRTSNSSMPLIPFAQPVRANGKTQAYQL